MERAKLFSPVYFRRGDVNIRVHEHGDESDEFVEGEILDTYPGQLRVHVGHQGYLLNVTKAVNKGEDLMRRTSLVNCL